MRKFLVLSSVVLLSSAWAALPAHAGSISFTSTPKSGPAGTVISVSGTSCPGQTVEVELDDPSDEFVADVTINTNDDEGGTWSGSITVPAGAAAGMYTLQAHCTINVEQGFNYNPNTFEVTVTAESTSTTAVPPVTVTPAPVTTTTVPVVQQAPPAAPVVAEPVTAG